MKITYTLADIQNRKAHTLRQLRATKREVNLLAADVVRPRIAMPKYLTMNSMKRAYGIYCKARHAYKLGAAVVSLFKRR